MRTLLFENEVELVQFKVGEDWYVFTQHLVIHAPIDQLYTLLIDIYDNKPDVKFLEDLDHLNAVEAYKEEHYPELCLPVEL